jgi:hypothetical protein
VLQATGPEAVHTIAEAAVARRCEIIVHSIMNLLRVKGGTLLTMFVMLYCYIISTFPIFVSS